MSTRTNAWEVLFQRALVLIDSAIASGGTLNTWSFGGGTVLMRRHSHRFSKDIDIFVPDPQIFAYLSPHLNETAGALTGDYVQGAEFLKLSFEEGEIDFVASSPLTTKPCVEEPIFGRLVQVETSAEIVAKKVWHRGVQFRARDIFDLAMVLKNEPEALLAIAPILRDRRGAILARLGSNAGLREAFDALDKLDYRRSFDECVELTIRALDRACA